MKSRHRTAKGREFNMQAFTSNQGNTIAVGNTFRNAQGDLLGPGGKIIATAQEITAKVYDSSPQGASRKNVKLNPMEQEVRRKEIVGADGKPRWEVTYADGSIEIQDKTEAAAPASPDKTAAPPASAAVSSSEENFENDL